MIKLQPVNRIIHHFFDRQLLDSVGPKAYFEAKNKIFFNEKFDVFSSIENKVKEDIRRDD